jgi:hypothetical protein
MSSPRFARIVGTFKQAGSGEIEMQRCKRIQFSLRKLLLWTTAVAVLLAALRMMGSGVTGFAIVLGGTTILGVLRSLFEPRHALMLWMLVVAVAGVVVAVGTTWELANAYGLSLGEIVLNAIWLSFWGFVFGSATGAITYTWTDAACRFLDWLDSLIQSADAR